MGNPKFPRKKYTTPLHPWKEERIKSERELLKKYGLKNHKEVWKTKTYLGRHRHQARELLAKMETKDPQVKKESDQLLLHLTRIGVLPAASSLDDVLALETESVLSRRLQTLVYLKGLSTTPDHSRQLINHGHIAINKRKVTIPGYMVTKDEENEIGYTGKSPLNEMSHPARPKTDVYKTGITPTEEKKTEEPKEPVKPKEKPDIKEEKTAVKEEKTEEPKEPVKPKEKPDIKEEKTVIKEETKDTKEDAAEPTKKSEEKTENKDVKEEKTEEPKEPVKPKEKPDIKEEKTVVKEETTTPVKQSEDDKKERPTEDKKPELPSEIKKESAEDKTEPVEKPETKNKKSNEKEGGN